MNGARSGPNMREREKKQPRIMAPLISVVAPPLIPERQFSRLRLFLPVVGGMTWPLALLRPYMQLDGLFGPLVLECNLSDGKHITLRCIRLRGRDLCLGSGSRGRPRMPPCLEPPNRNRVRLDVSQAAAAAHEIGGQTL